MSEPKTEGENQISNEISDTDLDKVTGGSPLSDAGTAGGAAGTAGGAGNGNPSPPHHHNHHNASWPREPTL
jgi:hypothetical protein